MDQIYDSRRQLWSGVYRLFDIAKKNKDICKISVYGPFWRLKDLFSKIFFSQKQSMDHIYDSRRQLWIGVYRLFDITKKNKDICKNSVYGPFWRLKDLFSKLFFFTKAAHVPNL